MSPMKFEGDFIKNLPKIYGFYTGGFLIFVLLMALGEKMGMSEEAIGISFVGFTIAIYALIADAVPKFRNTNIEIRNKFEYQISQ